jgi:hypothetical protein
MYTPSYIKRQNQFTPGGEYMINGQEYIGYYNITARGPYTGRVFADREQPLSVLRVVLNEQSQLYDELATKNGYTTDLEFDDPVAAQTTITAKDKKSGFINRYFLQQRNDKRARIKEIDKVQFDSVSDGTAGINPNLYKSVALRWKITGPEFDIKDGDTIITPGVRDTNARTLKEKSNIIRGLYLYLKNYLAIFSPYAISDKESNTDIQL